MGEGRCGAFERASAGFALERDFGLKCESRGEGNAWACKGRWLCLRPAASGGAIDLLPLPSPSALLPDSGLRVCVCALCGDRIELRTICCFPLTKRPWIP